MEDVDLETGLQSLRSSLEQMKALLAWEQLKRSETRPSQLPGSALDSTTETDLRNEYSSFLSTAVQMHSIINDSTFAIPEALRQSIGKQLAKIEQQVYGLALHERFWRC